MRFSFFHNVTWHGLAEDCLTFEDGTNRLSRNIGK